MKKTLLYLSIFALLFALFPIHTAFAETNTLFLPGSIVVIEDEAFAGDTTFETVVIPKTVQKIGSKAFANCSGLTEIIFGKNTEIEIAPDAFDGCSKDLHFLVYPDTPAELFGFSKGYVCDWYDPTENPDAFARVKELVKNNGGVSSLQSTFESKRLIVRRSSNCLPDISEYNPSKIIRKGDVFIIQFDTERNTTACWGFLKNDWYNRGAPENEYVEVDRVVSASFSTAPDEVQAAGVMYEPEWINDDPMGFDVYAPFVGNSQNSGEDCLVAVIDSGVSRNISYDERLRDDLAANFVPDDESWSNDYKNHGSFIASVINECCGNLKTGPKVYILPIRVFGNEGSFSDGNTDTLLFAEAIDYAVECGADVINLSANFDYNDHVKHTILQAIASGCRVVVAAGNSGKNTADVFPANIPGVITVAGIDKNYKLRGNSGTEVMYCAPFGAFNTALGMNQGTSFSAPMISSALALVSLDPFHDENDMIDTCLCPNETGTNANSYGHGMPQLERLAQIEVEWITLDEHIPNVLGIGKEDTELKWTVGPDNATNKTVTVTSSNPAVLAVVKDESSGKVYARGVSTGTATLTFRAESGVSVTKDFQVDQPVETIAILGGNNKLAVGRTLQLTTTITPTSPTNETIVWSSSDTSKATVSPSGLVTALRSGTVTITATAQDGFGANKSVTIQIVDQPDAEEVVLSIAGQAVPATLSLKPNETAQLTATVRPADADQAVTFDSSNEDVAVVSSAGLITAKSSGSTTITVTSADEKASSTLKVTVLVMPTSVAISGPSAVNQGSTITLTATVSPSDAYDHTVTWQSDNPSIARVDPTTGVVTGVSGGSTTIRAFAKGDQTKYGAKQITVRAPFTLSFDVNAKNTDGSTDTSAVASYTSKTVYNGGTIGSLPKATRDYYAFNGWWTAANGGTQITESSVASSSTAKLYAHWTLNAESDWVLPNEVPADALITDTSYSYRESIESPTADNPGWIADGWFWKEDGNGSKYYAYFPSTYDTGNSYYTEYRHEPVPAFENETTKREVNNVQDGWIYWHWMYNCVYASVTDRTISSKAGTFSSGNVYKYFHAMASAVDCLYLSNDYCYGGSMASYNAHDVVMAMTTSSQRNDNHSGIGTDRYFRFERYKSNYTDYVKTYKYYRDMEYQHEDPGSGSDGITITDKVTYVKYRMKYGSISSWSETKPEGVDERLIQTKTQYRYSDKETTTSTNATMSGWTLYDTQQVWGEYGPWTGWSSTSVSASESTKVETRTAYGWYYFECPNCHAHMHGYGTCWTWCGGCGAKTYSDGWHVMYDGTNWNVAQDWYGTGKYYAIINGERWFRWDDGGTETQYRSSSRTQSTVYSFYRWSDWSSWGDTVYTASDGRRVETRTLYRYVIS